MITQLFLVCDVISHILFTPFMHTEHFLVSLANTGIPSHQVVQNIHWKHIDLYKTWLVTQAQFCKYIIKHYAQWVVSSGSTRHLRISHFIQNRERLTEWSERCLDAQVCSRPVSHFILVSGQSPTEIEKIVRYFSPSNWSRSKG